MCVPRCLVPERLQPIIHDDCVKHEVVLGECCIWHKSWTSHETSLRDMKRFHLKPLTCSAHAFYSENLRLHPSLDTLAHYPQLNKNSSPACPLSPQPPCVSISNLNLCTHIRSHMYLHVHFLSCSIGYSSHTVTHAPFSCCSIHCADNAARCVQPAPALCPNLVIISE